MISPLAIVHPRAEIDSTAEIGPWCTVGPSVKIGARTILKSHVVVDGRTTIGEDNVIFPFAAIGMDPQDLKYRGEDTEIVIGHRNRIRESATIHKGTEQGGGVTTLGDDNLIMAYSHLAHDCRVGSHVVLSNAVGLAGHVVVHDWAVINAYTGVAQFLTVGAHCYIAATSFVDRDVPPYSIAIGARPIKLKSANIVGLRRRGFPVETIQKINDAIKLWSRQDVPMEQCLLEIESQYGELVEIQNFLQFIRASKSGVVR